MNARDPDVVFKNRLGKSHESLFCCGVKSHHVSQTGLEITMQPNDNFEFRIPRFCGAGDLTQGFECAKEALSQMSSFLTPKIALNGIFLIFSEVELFFFCFLRHSLLFLVWLWGVCVHAHAFRGLGCPALLCFSLPSTQSCAGSQQAQQTSCFHFHIAWLQSCKCWGPNLCTHACKASIYTFFSMPSPLILQTLFDK